MATSNSYNWSLTANGIINEALEDLNVIAPGGTPSSTLTTSCLSMLERVTKTISAKGIRIWSIDWVQKTFSAPSEVTGTDGNIYTCVLSHTGAADNRPITGANYTTFWVRKGVSGGTWSTSSYTSTGDFDAENNTLNILQAFIRENTIDTPLGIGNIHDYFSISDKTIDGVPKYLYFDKLRTGHIYLYPQPDFSNYSNYVLHYLRESMLEDFDAVGNDPDFQSIYLDYLIKELRLALAPKFRKSREEIVTLREDRNEAFNILRKKESSHYGGNSITPAFDMGMRRHGQRNVPEGSGTIVYIDSP